MRRPPVRDPNSIKLKGDASIAVTVLTTKAGEYGNPLAFDASTVDPLSVRFGLRGLVLPDLGGGTEIHKTGHLEGSLEQNNLMRRPRMGTWTWFSPSHLLLLNGAPACERP